MSSLEIAELTGKRHADVMRDIRTMLRDLGQGLRNFAQAYRHPQNGQEFPCFNLPRDLTFTLVTGYSIPLRKKVIDRWMELEEAERSRPMVVLPDFSDPAAAARAWAAEYEAKTEATAALAIAAPKATAYSPRAGTWSPTSRCPGQGQGY